MGNIVLTLVLRLTISLRWLRDSSRELIWEFTWTNLRVDSYLVAFVHNIFHSLFYFLLCQRLIIKLILRIYHSKQLFLLHDWWLIWCSRAYTTGSWFGISIHWDVSVIWNSSLGYPSFDFLGWLNESLRILGLVLATVLTVLFLKCHLFSVHELDTPSRNDGKVLGIIHVWGWGLIAWPKLILINR